MNIKNNSKISVIGDLMLDQYWYSSVDRISPEAPIPVIKVNSIDFKPGGASNVASNIRSMGNNVNICGIIGNDDNGIILKNLLKTENISSSLIISNSKTLSKIRTVNNNHHVSRIDIEEDFSYNSKKLVIKKLKNLIKYSNIVIISDYGKGTLHYCDKIIKECKSQKKFVIVDPKSKDPSKYSNVDLITPNLKEFENFQIPKEITSIIKKAQFIINKYNIKNILITKGSDGMLLVEKNKYTNINTDPTEVFDVTGAGDTVVASIALCLNRGISIYDAAIYSNRVARNVISKFGSRSISSLEFDYILKNNNKESFSKFINISEMKKIEKILHSKNKKIVMTNGCFDVIHSGHIHFLKKAKSLGDFLIVAINSDSSVRQNKGINRPINKLKDRISVLSSMIFVDYIIVFAEKTPLKIYNFFKPDILVKGRDYKLEQIVGNKEVIKNKGKVILIPYKKGYSSSNIIKKSLK